MKKLTLVLFLLFSTSAYSQQTQYLGNSPGHCALADLEPYVEYSQNTNTGTGQNLSGYLDDRATVGIRLRIPLLGTCTTQYQKIMLENELLKQQMELLKQCAKYQNLELGPQFSEVSRMCAGVNVKPGYEEVHTTLDMLPPREVITNSPPGEEPPDLEEFQYIREETELFE